MVWAELLMGVVYFVPGVETELVLQNTLHYIVRVVSHRLGCKI